MSVPEHPSGALRTGSVADELARGQVNLEVVVVSPARTVFHGEAHWVTAPGTDGQLGIWPQHAPIVVALASGPLRIGLHGGEVTRFAVRGGFLEVAENRVTILVDTAVAPADVDEEEAKRDLTETLLELNHPKSDKEFAELLDRRAWSQTRLTMAKR